MTLDKNHPGPHVGPIRHWIGRLWLKAFGWKIEGEVPPVSRAVFVANPHTSGWDLPFTLAVAWSMHMNVSWIGKNNLFVGPLRWFFRALGGVPVDRSKNGNQVQKIADAILREDRCFLVIAPEGTRKRKDHWKSGFYHIAREAGVPLLLAFMDYTKKVGGLGPSFVPTGDIKRDMDVIREFYRGRDGKFPTQASTIRLKEEDAPAFALADAAE
jgi:1-acyl-sn-glycerol-3-phosphate acyltransferase